MTRFLESEHGCGADDEEEIKNSIGMSGTLNRTIFS
jgi:hypothetical protein